MKLKIVAVFFFIGASALVFSQVDEQTPEEQAYRDSITTCVTSIQQMCRDAKTQCGRT